MPLPSPTDRLLPLLDRALRGHRPFRPPLLSLKAASAQRSVLTLNGASRRAPSTAALATRSAAGSPRRLPKCFCSQCGGHLYSDASRRVVRLAPSTASRIRPQWHQGWSRRPTGATPTGLPRFAQRRVTEPIGTSQSCGGGTRTLTRGALHSCASARTAAPLGTRSALRRRARRQRIPPRNGSTSSLPGRRRLLAPTRARPGEADRATTGLDHGRIRSSRPVSVCSTDRPSRVSSDAALVRTCRRPRRARCDARSRRSPPRSSQTSSLKPSGGRSARRARP